MDDFGKYEKMRQSGVNAETVYQSALRDGLNRIVATRMIRAVFDIGLGEAKDVIARAEGHEDSSAAQANLTQSLVDALKRGDGREDC